MCFRHFSCLLRAASFSFTGVDSRGKKDTDDRGADIDHGACAA